MLDYFREQNISMRILRRNEKEMMMTENNGIQKPQKSYVGLGLVFGLGLGSVYGQLFLNGNLGAGAGIGLALGLAIGSIADSLGRTPVFTLLGVGLGATFGVIAQVFLLNGVMGLGGAFGSVLGAIGAAVGLVVGTLIDNSRGRPNGEGYPTGEQNTPALPATHPLAIISLILGILGLVAVLPLVGAIGAVISGNMARQDIQQQPAFYRGDGLAKTGVILGWIGIVLGVLICLSLVVGLLLFNFSVIR